MQIANLLTNLPDLMAADPEYQADLLSLVNDTVAVSPIRTIIVTGTFNSMAKWSADTITGTATTLSNMEDYFGYYDYGAPQGPATKLEQAFVAPGTEHFFVLGTSGKHSHYVLVSLRAEITQENGDISIVEVSEMDS